jgi:hypothetical protein
MMHNAVIIGSRPQARRSLSGERRSPSRNSLADARRPFIGRIPNEFYPTPPEATRALLSVEQFDGAIWEPACGDGAIARVLHEAGHAVVSTDLHPYGFGESGVDFLREKNVRATHIVTNPPYGRGLADAFVTKALALTRGTGGKVAMLLNLASLCHPARTALWQQLRPARLYAIDGVVCWPARQYGPAPEYFTRHRYVWAVWCPDHCGATAFDWLSAGAFRR